MGSLKELTHLNPGTPKEVNKSLPNGVMTLTLVKGISLLRVLSEVAHLTLRIL